jgi:hypothetical protein
LAIRVEPEKIISHLKMRLAGKSSSVLRKLSSLSLGIVVYPVGKLAILLMCSVSWALGIHMLTEFLAELFVRPGATILGLGLGLFVTGAYQPFANTKLLCANLSNDLFLHEVDI